MDSTVLKPLNRPKARQIAIQTAILINSDFNFYSLVFIAKNIPILNSNVISPAKYGIRFIIFLVCLEV